MLRKLKLSLKFTFILGIVFISGIILSGLLITNNAHGEAKKDIKNQATILMGIMNSVRDYTDNSIEPLLAQRLETSPTFIKEIIPTYAARQVFQKLRKSRDQGLSGYDFLYKEATLNPTNFKDDKADKFEVAIVNKFRQDTTLTELTGNRIMSGENLFYIAKPLVIDQQSCLRCHSTPDQAPKSQINTYGSIHGFGWKLHEVVAAQIVYISTEEMIESYNNQLHYLLGTFIGVFAILIIMLNIFLKQIVIKPLIPLARLAKKISGDQIGDDKSEEADLKTLDKLSKRSDELGELSALFKRMIQIISQREQSLNQTVQKLRRETDSAKKAAMQTNLGDINSLQSLLKRAREARKG